LGNTVHLSPFSYKHFFVVFIANFYQGWNSWNHFACNITEDLIKDTIDSVISLKLSTVGYKYVNMDDCWQASSRDENGNLFADTTRFPNGVKALSDYAHSKGN
jgi:alpha-galactosidase